MTDYARDPNNLTPAPDDERFAEFPASDLSEHIEVVNAATKVFAERIQIINLPEDGPRVHGVVTGGQYVDPETGYRYAWAVNPEPLPDPTWLSEGWKDLGYISEDEPADAVSLWSSDPRAAYAFPLRSMAGVDQADYDDVLIDWQQPTTLTIELTNVQRETLELVAGIPLIPLCDRRLPAEGQE